MVLGHSGCGAVSAALGNQTLTPLLEQLVQPMGAAIPRRLQDLEQGMEHNACSTAALTAKSQVLAGGWHVEHHRCGVGHGQCLRPPGVKLLDEKGEGSVDLHQPATLVGRDLHLGRGCGIAIELVETGSGIAHCQFHNNGLRLGNGCIGSHPDHPWRQLRHF